MTRARELAEMLESLAEDARSGELTDVFVVFAACDGSHGHLHHTTDLGDLLLQVRTEVIRAQFLPKADDAERQH